MIFSVLLLAQAATSLPQLINTDVHRRYQIDNNVITVTIAAQVMNQGDEQTSKYTFKIPRRELEHIGLATASLSRKNARNFEESLPIEINNDEYTVNLKKSIAPGDTVTIYFSYTLGDYFLFLKQKIELNQKIQLYFNTTKFFKSDYETKKSTLTIEGISKNSIISKTDDSELKVTSSSLSLNKLTEDDGKDFEVEFYTTHSLLRADKIESRTLVSHWGKTKQVTYNEWTNAGPKFSGEFNRIDFNRNTPCYVQTIDLIPPSGSYNFWASDESGLLQKELNVVGTILPIPLRGPMLSSWKATFSAGWTVDTKNFVSGKYRFRAPLITQSSSAPITKVSAEFILPEGSQISGVTVPIKANISQYVQPNNLDFNGRNVVHIEVEHLSTNDIIPITIDYTISFKYHFLKIFTLGTAFSVIFLFIIVIRRFDCGVTKIKKNE